MTTDALDHAERIGREYAEKAIEAGGPDPTDHAGGILLPTEPLDADREFFADELGREPTDEERDTFSRAYEERMRSAIDALKAARSTQERDA